jgi:hypothetical protein
LILSRASLDGNQPVTREVPFRLYLVAFLGQPITAGSGLAVVESSATAITVRYGSLDKIDQATQLAQKACAVHRKTARLSNTARS